MGNKKIAIQGSEGSFSHIAADYIFKNNYELIKNDNFQICFEQCKSGEVDYAVVPFENSTHGSVSENYDLLSKYNLSISEEIYLKINFHLIGFEGVQLDEIKKLYSHRVSMSQIKDFLDNNPQIRPEIHSDNGRAVEYIKKLGKKENVAAASKLAAEINGMSVLQENIHDNPKNYTRFFVISRSLGKTEDTNKVSLEFQVKHEPGSLTKVLKSFSERNIDLMKIESRPILNTVWEYKFYADLLAGINDEIMIEALQEVKNSTMDLKILGSYKNGEYINT